jgi:hypothetical protein
LSIEKRTFAKKDGSETWRLEYISLFSYIWFIQPRRKEAESEDSPKHRDMTV